MSLWRIAQKNTSFGGVLCTRPLRLVQIWVELMRQIIVVFETQLGCHVQMVTDTLFCFCLCGHEHCEQVMAIGASNIASTQSFGWAKMLPMVHPSCGQEYSCLPRCAWCSCNHLSGSQWSTALSFGLFIKCWQMSVSLQVQCCVHAPTASCVLLRVRLMRQTLFIWSVLAMLGNACTKVASTSQEANCDVCKLMPKNHFGTAMHFIVVIECACNVLLPHHFWDERKLCMTLWKDVFWFIFWQINMTRTIWEGLLWFCMQGAWDAPCTSQERRFNKKRLFCNGASVVTVRDVGQSAFGCLCHLLMLAFLSCSLQMERMLHCHFDCNRIFPCQRIGRIIQIWFTNQMEECWMLTVLQAGNCNQKRRLQCLAWGKCPGSNCLCTGTAIHQNPDPNFEVWPNDNAHCLFSHRKNLVKVHRNCGQLNCKLQTIKADQATQMLFLLNAKLSSQIHEMDQLIRESDDLHSTHGVHPNRTQQSPARCHANPCCTHCHVIGTCANATSHMKPQKCVKIQSELNLQNWIQSDQSDQFWNNHGQCENDPIAQLTAVFHLSEHVISMDLQQVWCF